jgi:hypothetical protein
MTLLLAPTDMAQLAGEGMLKFPAYDGCGRQQPVASPRCLRINGEDYCP